MFQRIAVVNRGESAMRLIHAVRDLNAQGRAIEVIALHTDAERDAMFVRRADIAYSIGPAAQRPYLNHGVLAEALQATGADAAWVGWGFVAEDPAFAETCARIGVTFIGPSAEAMRKLGDKIGSKLIAEEVGVPVAPWSRGAVDSLDDALAAADHIGYPLMLKATAGGGGRGIRTIRSAEELRDAYQRTRDEAERAFGSGVVFLERLVTGARHVEVQVIADGQGTAWAVGVRDCSVQRRNQKVIEESASPLLDPSQTDELKAAAERLALVVDYRGAGTVEFLYHPGQRTFAFLEVNTRLQVEHPITEATTSLDLVKAQIHIAEGEPLTGTKPAEVGHAVEARLNAEDPDRDFAPAPGRIALLRLPAGPGIRVDTGVAEGDSIPADFDSMIAKIIAVGRDRDEALARLRRAMTDTTVIIEGGTTNKSFILDLLDQPEVVGDLVEEGIDWADTGWIDRVRSEGRLKDAAHGGIALIAAAIGAYEEEEALEVARLLTTARGGRPQVQPVAGQSVDLKLRGNSAKLAVSKIGAHRFRIEIIDPNDPAAARVRMTADVSRIDDFTSRLTVNDRTYRLVTATHGPVHLVEVDGVMHRVSRDEGGVLRSPAPALVVAAPVAVGDEVAAGAPVLVLESMKMETVLPAPFAATVREILVKPGGQVETGAALVRLEPVADVDVEAEADSGAGQSGLGLDLPLEPEEPTAAAEASRALDDLSASVLGFDGDIRATDGALERYLRCRETLVADGVDVLPREVDLLTLFADFAELGRNRPLDEQRHTELRVHSTREHFHSYLQTLDIERSGLPAEFEERLRTVLAHYGITELERTPELEEALFRVFLAQQRTGPDVLLVTSLLRRWLVEPAPGGADAITAADTLSRLLSATALRFPVVADLARSVRFRWFDQPLVDRERESVLAGVADKVAALSGLPDGPERRAGIEELAAIPEQLVQFLAQRSESEIPDDEPMLEVLIKRHYREFDLADLGSTTTFGRQVTTADYVLDERPTKVISAVGRVEELTNGSALTSAVESQIDARRDEQEIAVDLYLQWPQVPVDPDDASRALCEAVAELDLVHRVRRVSVAVAPGGGRAVEYYTFRPAHTQTGPEAEPGEIEVEAVAAGDPEVVVEDDLVRGIHPMVARRLNLWRLRDFHLTRLPAPDGVLLYQAVARDNPADQRLVALAQVRQVAVLRDDQGRVTGLPHAERAVEQCMDAIRQIRTARGDAGAKLDTNHVWVQVWPVVEANLEDLRALESRITPLTDGTGIEEVLAQGRVAGPDGRVHPIVLRFYAQPGAGVTSRVEAPPTQALKPIDEYQGKVLRARRRGLVYPYEIQDAIAGPGGTITEYDLDDSGTLVPVDRPRGLNKAGILVAVATTPTALHPDGITRVVLCGDPIKALGAVSEAECTRIIAALDLADQRGIPVEWFAVSAGARISMDSGTENMDWVAAALRRIVEFTQAGGEINIVVAGINVGAQPYWNAEATMLMHTKGILVMTPDSAMVLTGKQSLDFSGGVSAEDNHGIGGFDRVMGPNGQAQYWAPNLLGALRILLTHYDHTYVVPGEDRPRRVATSDPAARDISAFPHDVPESDFTTVGQIFSAEHNPDRKKAFDIRTVMRALADADHTVLERWALMADAETAVVYDTHIGGFPICMVGIESKPVPRRGFPPTDGPDTYTAGTLFPRSSKKVARAINSASGNRPVVVLANLSGFDGSPDSMRNLQLEYGAEIGRAVVNFDGPIVFCVISRYHGGAFVVFSKSLNPQMTVLAVEGSFASVIGGAPAAAVVFAGEVARRVSADPRVAELEEKLRHATGRDHAQIGLDLADLRSSVRAEKISEVAAEFDAVHNIHRAVEVGSVDAVVAAADLRPQIIQALDRALTG